MVTSKKVFGKAMSMPAGVGIGSAVSLFVTICGSVLLAYLMNSEILTQDTIGYGAMVILLVSSFLGAAISAGLIKHRKLIVCLIHAGLFFALLLLINGLAFGGTVSGAGATALLIMGGEACAVLVGSPRGGKKRHVPKKWRTG